MSALTPDLDPDMTHDGQPWRGKSSPGAAVLSTVVLLALLGASLAVVTKDAVVGAFDFAVAPVGLLAAYALVRRAARGVAFLAGKVAAALPRPVGVRPARTTA